MDFCAKYWNNRTTTCRNRHLGSELQILVAVVFTSSYSHRYDNVIHLYILEVYGRRYNKRSSGSTSLLGCCNPGKQTINYMYIFYHINDISNWYVINSVSHRTLLWFFLQIQRFFKALPSLPVKKSTKKKAMPTICECAISARWNYWKIHQ